MKTEGTPDVVWSNNVELLSNEECLPVFGSSQVSSILQTLDGPVQDNTVQNMDLIILADPEYKVPVGENNYVVLKENGSATTSTTNGKKGPEGGKKDETKKSHKDFENMLYFVCNLCPFLCTNSEKIREHLENAHKNKSSRKLPQMKCPACANIFYHKMSLRSHLIHDHGVSNSDLGDILQAIVYYSQKNGDQGTGSKKNVPEVKETSKTQEREELFSSDSFNAATKTTILPKVDPLSNKIAVETVPRCSVSTCKVRLQDPIKMNYHIQSHTEAGFKCLDCDEHYMFWRPFTGHLWRQHKIDMELYACDVCDYKTFNLSKLNTTHKLIHSDVRPFSCETCKKGFKNTKQLRNHRMTHKDKSKRVPVLCEFCKKYFSDKRQLKIHVDRVHMQIKPFLCSYCGYKGSSKNSLKMHIRQHTGEKPFSCEFCPYTTADHNSLRRHKLRHTGQKPYKCAHCSYACIQSSTFKVHLKNKHPGKEQDHMFTCPDCQYRSVNKEMYTSHMLSAHKKVE